ncbi:MAG TPA: glycosyl hydrolase [Bryobacteraceae bacterium]|nr:glycosyl hydrolase [Bryobacteraceae bacterium]
MSQKSIQAAGRRRILLLSVGALLALTAAVFAQQQSQADFDPAVFKAPPAQYRGHAMWSFNLTTLDQKSVISGIDEMAKLNYGGFFIEAGGRPRPGQGVGFLSDEYFRYYRMAIDEAKKQGLEMILYDDYSFPTGTVGGQLAVKYPQYMAKNLDMTEKDVTGPVQVELDIPKGIYMGAVMMNRDNFDLVDVSNKKSQDKVVCRAPKGNWKLMVFYLTEGHSRVVDYLNPQAMTAFISMTYDKYEKNFGDEFGKLIKQTFYDEPSMHHADRMWTPDFNSDFQKKYGYSPMKYYPALWYNIGPQTAAARNALWGFRAELYATNFIKRLNDWCAQRHLLFGGHTDQEEPLNPTPLTGDLMKVFQYQTLPTIDDIWWYGRSNPSYKIVTSAGFNFDHPIIRAETFAAYRGLTDKIAYKVTMDQYAMGVNYQIPARTVQPKRPELNEYVGRLTYLLEHGRHVADVAVLYPIAALRTQYRNLGGVTFPLSDNEKPPQIREEAYSREGGYAYGMDYQDIGEDLFRGMRLDYTYLHPDVLVNRCSVDSSTHKLILNNQENREEYSVLILPSGNTISAAAAEKIKEFYDKGGQVIATGLLPTRSSEFGKDKEVQKAMADVFGVSDDAPLKADVIRAQDRQNYYVFWYFLKKNAAGGKAIFLPNTHPWLLNYVMNLELPVRDVTFDEPMGVLRTGNEYDGALTYIHKVKDNRDIYYFANSSPDNVDTKVVLRGHKTLTIWDPLTGEQRPAEITAGEKDGQPITTVHLVLPSVASLFYIEN